MSIPIPLPKGYQRLDPFPLDATTVFATYNQLLTYASSNPTAYAGQVCSVSSTNVAYIINFDKTISPISEVNALSGSWQNVFTHVRDNSGSWTYQGTDIKALTGNWQNTYTHVRDNSGNWTYLGTDIKTLTANWQNVFTHVRDNSASWEETADIIPTFTNYLSTNSVQISALTITNTFSGINSLTVFGNISATGILHGRAQDLTLNATSTNTVTNSAITNALQLLVPAPTYTPSVASLEGFNTTFLEIGSTVNQTLGINWTQNEAGSFQPPWRLNKNGGLVVTGSGIPNNYTVNETVVLGTTTYQLSVSHNTGLIKNNILGFPDSRGQILAGSVLSTPRSYTGTYRRWIGSTTTFPSNGNSIRTSGLTTSLDTDGNTLSPVLISNKFILIAIPSNRTLTTVITEANENLTTQFSLSNIHIQDAGNVSQTYKLYYLETALPLNATLTNVTIANV